jgi:3-oxoacyl-[acyl-carrier protein] reductase
MPLSLTNHVALVTGGSRGIGRAICQALDAEGARIIVHYHRDLAAAEESASTLQSPATLVHADLGSTDSITRMVGSLDEDSLDILVNNAGVWKPTPLGSTSEALLDEVLHINLRGMFWLTQALLTKLRDGARIVNISSTAGRVGIAGGRSLYGATKAAVDSLTKSWALELAGRRIRVNAVAPGYVETDMTAAHLSDPFLKHRKLNLLLHRIDAVHQHANPLSQTVGLPRPLPDNLARVLVIGIPVVVSVFSGTSPSTNKSVSSTKNPNLVTLVMSPSKSSPTRSCMNLTFFHSINSRSASSARRSAWLDSSAMSCSSSIEIGPPSGSCASRCAAWSRRFDHGEGAFDVHPAGGAAMGSPCRARSVGILTSPSRLSAESAALPSKSDAQSNPDTAGSAT